MKSKFTSITYSLLLAFLVSFGLLHCLGTIEGFTGLYSANAPYYNIQASALSKGRLAIALDPRNLAFDLAWGADGVNQVWGLGIPSWILLLSTLTCKDPLLFPSRLAFGIALCLVIWCTILHFISATRKEPLDYDLRQFLTVLCPSIGILFLYPPFCTLLKSCFRVYEESCAYTFIYSVGLAILLQYLSQKLKLLGLLILAIAAAFGPFIRPTLLFYGFSALLVASSWGMRARLSILSLGSAWCLYLFLLTLLLVTNHFRFGAAFEFGHSLNVSYHAENTYCLKFHIPYQQEGWIPATKELGGALLFDEYSNRAQWFAEGVFAWQSPTTRFRENYLSGIGWPLVLFAAAGSIATLITSGRDRNCPLNRAVSGTIAYSLLALIGLTAFYLRCPVLSSRYLYDFSGALAVMSSASWWYLSSRSVRNAGWITATVSIIGLCYLFYRGQATRCDEIDAVSCSKNAYKRTLDHLSVLKHYSSALPNRWKVQLSVDSALRGEEIPFDGAGWVETSDGTVSIATIHFVRDMKYLEMTLMPDSGLVSTPRAVDQIQAKVGLEYLTKERIERMPDGKYIIKFKPPRDQRYAHGFQIVYVAWLPSELIGKMEPSVRLQNISWGP